jgi:hypothetical protein
VPPPDPGVVLVRVGPRVALVRPASRSVDWSAELSVDSEPGTGSGPGERTEEVAASVLDAVRRAAPRESALAVLDPPLARGLERLGVRLRPISPDESRAAWEAAWARLTRPSREFYFSLARRALAHAFEDPDEIVASLAREEERVERVVGRERSAATQWPAAGSEEVAGYRSDWERTRGVLEAHHARLLERVERAARGRAPNLASVVGPRVAARLIAAAGGLNALARMDASRVQLLGARRRPGPGPAARGPRFGLLFRADRMEEVPPGRRGAYARSLASLATIGARADAFGRRDIARTLLARRDRRIASLRRALRRGT